MNFYNAIFVFTKILQKGQSKFTEHLVCYVNVIKYKYDKFTNMISNLKQRTDRKHRNTKIKFPKE